MDTASAMHIINRNILNQGENNVLSEENLINARYGKLPVCETEKGLLSWRPLDAGLIPGTKIHVLS